MRFLSGRNKQCTHDNMPDGKCKLVCPPPISDSNCPRFGFLPSSTAASGFARLRRDLREDCRPPEEAQALRDAIGHATWMATLLLRQRLRRTSSYFAKGYVGQVPRSRMRTDRNRDEHKLTSSQSAKQGCPGVWAHIACVRRDFAILLAPLRPI